MRDKVLAYAVVISVGIHLLIFAAVGRSSAKPVEFEEVKLVKVDIVKSPEDEPEVVPEVVEPEPVELDNVIPSSEKTTIRPLPKPEPRSQSKPSPSPPGPVKIRSTSSKPAGNPGGPIDLGSTSSKGENLGGNGKTPAGWVPGDPDGKGIGSGKGEGIGKPEPVPEAVEGPGKESAPPPPPPPDVRVKVCPESGMLPGPNCERSVTRSFRPGRQPTQKCTVCKPPHVSTLADRSVPELVKGSMRPTYPTAAKARGIEGSVTVEYTINTEGKVVGVKVVKSSGNSDLDRAGMETVQGRTYKPAVQGGIARNYRKRETFHFTLD